MDEEGGKYMGCAQWEREYHLRILHPPRLEETTLSDVVYEGSSIYIENDGGDFE